MMRRRASLAEHPFGTLKCRAGYRPFLVRGLNKVRGEWSLLALCYNLARVLNILGIEGFKAKLALWAALLRAISAARGTARAVLSPLWTQYSSNARTMPLRLSLAA